MGGLRVAGGALSGLAYGGLGHLFNCGIPSGCDSHDCAGVGTVGGGSGLVGLRRTFSGVMGLAIADWKPVCGYGREIMASSGSPVGSV